jgi:hypothetical protein
MKDQLNNLEKIVDIMTTSLCKHGDKVEMVGTKMAQMCQVFNTTVCECQQTTDVITMFMFDDLRDRLKVAEEVLSSIVHQVKDREDTITILK